MKNRNFAIQLMLTQFLMVIIVCLEGVGVVDEFYAGIGAMLISAVNLLGLIRCKLLVTPLLFPQVYLLLFGLYELKLRTGMTQMPVEGKIVIVFCMLLWTLLCLGSPYVFRKVNAYSDFRFNLSRFKMWISALAFISAAMMLYEWYRAGGIPALRTDAETFRISVSQSGMTHTLAIMIKIVAVLIETYWISNKETKQPRNYWFICLYLVAMIMMWGTANRGELLFIPVLGIIILWTKYPPKKTTVFAVAIAGLVILAVYPAVRGYGLYGVSYFTQYSAVSTYPQLGWLMPLYGTLAYNFEILNRLFSTFPQTVPWGMGQYAIFCHIPFLNIGEELWVVQNRVWNNGFYGALTSTYLGSWYADFGFVGCFLGTFIICEANLYLYKKMVQKKSFGSLVLYSYLFYITLVGSYGDAFNFVFICYALVIWFVMNQCEMVKK